MTRPALPVVLRPATADDVDALLALVQSAYRGASSRTGWTTEADLLDGTRTTAELLAATVADPAVTVLVAHAAPSTGDRRSHEDPDAHRADPPPFGDHRELVSPGAARLEGCAAVTPRGPVAEFGTFAVQPTRQGTGLGSTLLAAAEAHARAHGASTMEMSVISLRTELIAFYRRRGYVDTGRSAPFPHGDERYGRPRRDDLEFLVLAKPLTG